MNELHGKTDEREIAEEFNTYFANIGEDLASAFVDDEHVNIPLPVYPPIFDLAAVDYDTVFKLIQDLPNGKAAGGDWLTTRFL